MDINLNKYISDSGYCSRRDADKYIEQLRVTVNGVEVNKGYRVKAGDRVAVDGELIKVKRVDHLYLALNKPKGITCTTDLKDPTNIIDFVNFKTRIFPVGRLDKRSEGLIFLTNDGDIVNKILRASNKHEKEYIVTVDKNINHEFVQTMSNGVKILGVTTKKCVVVQINATQFKIILTQGLNRQIRRMCEALGYKVTRLVRVRIMNMTLTDIPKGKWRFFNPKEIATMNELLSNSSKVDGGKDDDSGMDE